MSLSTVHVRVKVKARFDPTSCLGGQIPDSPGTSHSAPVIVTPQAGSAGNGANHRPKQTHDRAHPTGIAEPQACEEDVGDTRQIMKSLSVALFPLHSPLDHHSSQARHFGLFYKSTAYRIASSHSAQHS